MRIYVFVPSFLTDKCQNWVHRKERKIFGDDRNKIEILGADGIRASRFLNTEEAEVKPEDFV